MIERETVKAIVRDIDDPERRGRIRVECGDILAEGHVIPDWVEPCFPVASSGSGWFFLPRPGSIVDLEIVSNADEDEVYGMAFMMHPDYRWRSCLYGSAEDVPEPFRAKDGYGMKGGYMSPGGQLFMLDDKTMEVILRARTLRLVSDDASEPLVLGDVLTSFLKDVLDAIAAHTHPSLGSVPDNVATLELLKATLDGGAHLSDAAFVSKAGGV